MALFEEVHAQILGVSVNREAANKSFAEKIGVTFPLLSDAEKKVARQYGVLNFFRLASRTTFVADKQGVIRHIDRGRAAVDPDGAYRACRQIEHLDK